ncbi:uncharacterized protein LOC127160714 [Labeo rohita]|uniref:uncharacterized protein LOC127160714 n=1 Tax=Labeo rohita TaxID=84645 RepID=UPI0021E2BE51|nr:uncharacterized protein LOC127160714 [Labeo rohita]
MHPQTHTRGRNVTSTQRAKRKKKFTDAEVLELLFASDEEELSDCSSAPDSVSSGDEADFLEGIDPIQDIAEDVRGPAEPSEPPCTSESSVPICRGRGSRGDEANFFEEIDPSQGTAEDVSEPSEPPCTSVSSVPVHRGRGYGRRTNTRGYRSRSQRSRGNGRTLETAPNNSGGWKTENDPDHLPQSPHLFLPKRKPGVQPPLSTSPDNLTPIELFEMCSVCIFFCLENKHLNNCSEFRAVRDVSVSSLNADDQTLLEQKMKQKDHVRNRLRKKNQKSP